MNISIINNALKFYFSIPIIEEDNLFQFNKVTPIPIFSDNKTFLPDIDAYNIAISKSEADSDDEYRICHRKCWEVQNCLTHKPHFYKLKLCTQHTHRRPIKMSAVNRGGFPLSRSGRTYASRNGM